MRLAVVGTGYVGLVAGTCFAESGHQVVCVDSDTARIDLLSRGEIPIYEDGLKEAVARCLEKRTLSFTNELSEAIAGAEAVFVAVGTPVDCEGNTDLNAVFEVSRQVAKRATGPVLLVIKSTVPVGTNSAIVGMLNGVSEHPLEVVSNPEFLREGSALRDFRQPERVVLGVNSAEAAELLSGIFRSLVGEDVPIITMSPESAELSKFAANAMLAARVSFMNDIAVLCEKVGADVDAVRTGVGSDPRIGGEFLFPGAGYGGSCLPKDLRSFLAIARQAGSPRSLFQEVERSNERQKRFLVEKLERAFLEAGGLEGKLIAVWGLAFKPGTDDLREAPSVVLIRELLARGAQVRAHDPAAGEHAKAFFHSELVSGKLELVSTPHEGTVGADSLVLVTEWEVYREPDLKALFENMARPWVFDGRNFWDQAAFEAAGFRYEGVGRRSRVSESFSKRFLAGS